MLQESLYGLLAATAILIASCIFTHAYTTWKYHHRLRQFQNPQRAGKILEPPQIPYTIPFLGNALQFLNSQPGKFWNELFTWYPRSAGVCTLLVAGRTTHVLFSAPAVQALIKTRSTSRETFERDLMGRVFDFSADDAQIFFTQSKEPLLKLTHQLLLKHDASNELVDVFMRFLPGCLDQSLLQSQAAEKNQITGLYQWIRDALFNTSTKTIFGEELAKMYPGYYEDFYAFDAAFQKFFFGVPGFLNKEGLGARTRILDHLGKWAIAIRQSSKGESISVEGPSWDPILGSRLNRARMSSFAELGHSANAGASLDLGLTSALVSNAIPATAWMLLNILNPKADPSVLPKVLTAIKEAESSDGTLNVAKLAAAPLLQSIWTESLRLYTDVLLTRDLTEDIMLPLDDRSESYVAFHKGDNIFAPSWLAHRDSGSWPTDAAPLDEFDAERFLVKNRTTEAESYSLSENGGTFFPFGGGKTHCPGRVFAKSEAIGAFAFILHRYEITTHGFVDATGGRTSSFPRFRNALPGSMLLVPDGDLRVTVRRRSA